MNLILHTQYADPAVHGVSLAVEEASSTVLSVRADTFTHGGVLYTFDSDQDYTLVDTPAVDVAVTGYVVKDLATGDPALLVDEYYRDGEDVRYTFKPGDPYELLHYLFWFTIPSGGDVLGNLDVNVLHVVGFPEE